MSDRQEWDERIIVDEEDFPLISAYKWYPHKFGNQFYASTSTGILMHRLIMNAKQGQLVDHKNRNGLDNRRENLRLCTQSQNLHNRPSIGGTSKYKGVSKVGNRWRSYIWKNYKRTHLGYFSSEEDAAKAYDKAAIKLIGDFAYLNFGGK